MKTFKINERVDNNFGKMSNLMDSMTLEELNDLKIKTEIAYKNLGGDFFIHSLQIALINSKIARHLNV